jgi:hypothetical protein
MSYYCFVDRKIFDKWIIGLKHAWEAKNPKAAADLCSESVIYYEDPFQKPLMSRKAVYDVWLEVPETQKDINFKYKILTIVENICIAHWSASFTRVPSGVRSSLDGIYFIKLNKNGLCEEFHQWWNSKS